MTTAAAKPAAEIEEETPLRQGLAGVASQLLTGTITYPLDLAKTRIQVATIATASTCRSPAPPCYQLAGVLKEDRREGVAVHLIHPRDPDQCVRRRGLSPL